MRAPGSMSATLVFNLAGAGMAFTLTGLLALPGRTVCRQPTRVEHDLRTILSAVEMFHADRGRYPESGEMAPEWIAGSSGDPWGHEYLYEITSDGRPRATCLGSDNQPGGEGEAADTVLIGGG